MRDHSLGLEQRKFKRGRPAVTTDGGPTPRGTSFDAAREQNASLVESSIVLLLWTIPLKSHLAGPARADPQPVSQNSSEVLCRRSCRRRSRAPHPLCSSTRRKRGTALRLRYPARIPMPAGRDDHVQIPQSASLWPRSRAVVATPTAWARPPTPNPEATAM